LETNSQSLLEVAAFLDPAVVRALNATVEKSPLLGRQYRFVHHRLGDSPNSEQSEDLILVAVDLGQGVPLESLRAWSGRPGICAFQQPTPSQLLAVAELPNVVPMIWDGTQTDRLVERLHRLAQSHQEQLRLRQSLAQLSHWVAGRRQHVARVQLKNLPEDWKGARALTLDPQKALYRLGSAGSSADWILPVSRGAEAILTRVREEWILQTQKQTLGTLSCNQALRWDSVELLGAPDESVLTLEQISRRQGWLSPKTQTPSHQFLSELVSHLLLQFSTGELTVRSDNKSAKIQFFDGWICGASAGWVQGEKALFRCLSWEKPQWRFEELPLVEPRSQSLWMDASSFEKKLKTWKQAWSQIQGRTPPHGLRLSVVPTAFRDHERWSPESFSVLTAVAEYGLVQDVLNQSRLNDEQVHGLLISLRKQGLVVPVGSV